MQNSIVSGDDIRYLVQQEPSSLTTIIGQMTTLMQNITFLQDDTYLRTESIKNQNWFKRMWNTVTGKNKSSVEEISRNRDKIVGYISEAVAQLYQMNCIDMQIMSSLGNRMNQVYAQLTDVFNDQLAMKAQIAEIAEIQRQTIEALGGFVTRLNEKIESVDNFHMLVTEIEQGRYKDSSPLYSLCSVLAQLDKRILDDERKKNIIVEALFQSETIKDDDIAVSQYLKDIIALPDDKVGMVYLELCNYRNSFPANLFAEMIEMYHFLPKMEKMSKSKNHLTDKIMAKYELDCNAAFSFSDITESFLENKHNNLIESLPLLQAGGASEEDSVENVSDDPLSDIPEEIKTMLNNERIYFWDISEKDININSDILAKVQNAAEKGHSGAQFFMAVCYQFGKSITEDMDMAMKMYKAAAEQGHLGAQGQLGNIYCKGLNRIPQDYNEAVKWLLKAADQGDEHVTYIIERCYLKLGNEKESFKWLLKAAEQGIREAQEELGECYYYGERVEPDLDEALKWFSKAADNGDCYSMWFTGRMYFLSGDGKEAFKWFLKAAELNDVNSMYYVGLFCYKGIGVPENYEEAFKWFKKAAEQDDKLAQFFLGECYYNGYGVSQQRYKAWFWYRKAAEQGYEEAQERLNGFDW